MCPSNVGPIKPTIDAHVCVWYTRGMSTEVVVTKLSNEDDMFCLAVVEYAGNLGAAYRTIDPDEAYPVAKAREMLARPEIAQRVNQLVAIQDEHAGMSLGSHLQQLAHIRDLAVAKENFKVALDAENSRFAAVLTATKPKQSDDPEERRGVVQVFIGATPSNVNDWGSKYGQQPVVVDVVETRR